MGNLSWKIKQLLQKLMPIAIVVLALYTGYSLYRHGIFRPGRAGTAISSTLHHLPIFGSMFPHHRYYGEHMSSSYAYRGRYRRGRRYSWRHRRHHRRRHHRRR